MIARSSTHIEYNSLTPTLGASEAIAISATSVVYANYGNGYGVLHGIAADGYGNSVDCTVCDGNYFEPTGPQEFQSFWMAAE